MPLTWKYVGDIIYVIAIDLSCWYLVASASHNVPRGSSQIDERRHLPDQDLRLLEGIGR